MRALVAGIGNIFFGDDGFGVEVARRLRGHGVSGNVQVEDFGIRGFDLACALCEPWDLVVLLDAVARGGEPGSLYVIEPDLGATAEQEIGAVDAHGLNPMYAIRLAKTLGRISARLMLVGCEPASFDAEGQVLTLSTPVAAAVEDATETVQRILQEFQQAPVCVVRRQEAADEKQREFGGMEDHQGSGHRRSRRDARVHVAGP